MSWQQINRSWNTNHFSFHAMVKEMQIWQSTVWYLLFKERPERQTKLTSRFKIILMERFLYNECIITKKCQDQIYILWSNASNSTTAEKLNSRVVKNYNKIFFFFMTFFMHIYGMARGYWRFCHPMPSVCHQNSTYSLAWISTKLVGMHEEKYSVCTGAPGTYNRYVILVAACVLHTVSSLSHCFQLRIEFYLFFLIVV